MTKTEDWVLVPREPTEEMRNAGALGWWGHRCKGASTEERATDKCWNENEKCHCRIAYEGTVSGYQRMLAVAPAAPPSPDARVEELEWLRAALQDIANPLAALARDAEEQGAQLGATAFSIANDPEHIKSIARTALAKPDR